MNIIEKSSFDMEREGSGYHILTFAETGFAMLNMYGEIFGIDISVIERFSEEVNRKDESGSLHPKAPISAVPRRFVRDGHDVAILTRQIEDFLKANEKYIKAENLLIDFRAGVAPFVIEACRVALQSSYAKSLNDVVIINGDFA